MNVIVFASRKGGTGKSTLAAHLAAHCRNTSRSCLLIDADPQGSLSLWHAMRANSDPPLKRGLTDLTQTLDEAKAAGVEWVLMDTPPLVSEQVSEAIAAATLLVIPARPAVFDLNAVTETITVARLARRPFAIVLNAVPPKRLGAESPMAAFARRSLGALEAPVWSGQITQRSCLALSLADGGSVEEANSDARMGALEIAGLWTAIENSVAVIHGAYGAAAMHQRAA